MADQPVDPDVTAVEDVINNINALQKLSGAKTEIVNPKTDDKKN